MFDMLSFLYLPRIPGEVCFYVLDISVFPVEDVA